MRASGRWNEAGLPIVYLAESPAGALLEVCVSHFVERCAAGLYASSCRRSRDRIPLHFPGFVAAGLDSEPEITRELGNKWLRERASVLLKVPSAIVPQTSNYIFNPLHPDAAKFDITQVFQYPFDMRIKQ
jgi:RES domain-containing protein